MVLYTNRHILNVLNTSEQWSLMTITAQKKRPKRKTTHVSVRGESYDLVSAEAKKRGIKIKDMMEIIFKETEKAAEDQAEHNKVEAVKKYWDTKF